MYRKAYENSIKAVNHSTPEVEAPERRGIVAPKPLEEASYNPMEFIQRGMARIMEIREQGLRRRRSQPVQEETPQEKSFEKDFFKEPPQEEVSMEEAPPKRGLVFRPEPKSGGGFLGLIDRYESSGDYRALLGFSNRDKFSNIDITNMTLSEIDNFARTEYASWSKEWKRQNNHGNVNVPSTPMGRYQFVNTTLQAQARRLGLDPETTKFTPEVQDQLFESYLRTRLARADTMEGKVRQLRNAWEGFTRVPTPRLEAAIRDFEGKA
jgi:hypothetical protein